MEYELGALALDLDRDRSRTHLVFRLDERLNLDELWRLRCAIWADRRPLAAVELDCAAVTSVEADAALLLYDDLTRLSEEGTAVTLCRPTEDVRRVLRWHPLQSFFGEDAELFTDPDLDDVGFRPSRH